MRATRIVGLLCLGVSTGLSGCAAAGASTESGANTEHRVADATFMSNSYEFTKTLAVPIDRVWRVLPAVYDTLGIPIGRSDAAVHVMGNPGLKARRELNHTALSRLIDCGETQIGPNADTYDVQLSILTTLKARGDSTIVSTVLNPVARSQYAQGYSQCSSKQVLEGKITDAIRLRTGG